MESNLKKSSKFEFLSQSFLFDVNCNLHELIIESEILISEIISSWRKIENFHMRLWESMF